MAGEMIDLLRVSSIAIIDEVEIEFGKGLNCITGETGAGKSLIVDALKLLMGAKASSDIVRPGRQKAIIEALFTLPDKEIVLKREVYSSGKGRCYINGELTTTSKLWEIAQILIHIYGQHQYQDLLHPSQQISILEEMADIQRDRIVEIYNDLLVAKEKLLSTQKVIEDAKQQRQDLEYSLRELRSAHISKGEEERIIRELGIGHMSANLRQDALTAADTLYSGNPSLMDLAGQVRRLLASMANTDPDIKDDISSINSMIAQIEDLNYSLKDKIKGYEFDPGKIQELESRLQTIGELKSKYNTDEVGLLDILENLEASLSMIEDEEYLIEDAKNEFQNILGLYIKGIRSFLVKRKSFGKRLCTLINHDLAKLGMSGTKFSIQQLDESAFDKCGIDYDIGDISPNKALRGEFVISTNVGQDMLPLARVASGGELSRIMLALKCHQRESQDTTIVFDEIDSGISGEAAIMMANRLKELSGNAQTIVVTHLHSLASLANTHLVISKDVADDATTSHINMVTGNERVMELARMMGGVSPSDTVVAHAKELVNRAQYEE